METDRTTNDNGHVICETFLRQLSGNIQSVYIEQDEDINLDKTIEEKRNACGKCIRKGQIRSRKRTRIQ